LKLNNKSSNDISKTNRSLLISNNKSLKKYIENKQMFIELKRLLSQLLRIVNNKFLITTELLS